VILFVTFYVCLKRHFKNVKSHVLKSEKNIKYVFSNTGWTGVWPRRH